MFHTGLRQRPGYQPEVRDKVLHISRKHGHTQSCLGKADRRQDCPDFDAAGIGQIPGGKHAVDGSSGAEGRVEGNLRHFRQRLPGDMALARKVMIRCAYDRHGLVVEMLDRQLGMRFLYGDKPEISLAVDHILDRLVRRQFVHGDPDGRVCAVERCDRVLEEPDTHHGRRRDADLTGFECEEAAQTSLRRIHRTQHLADIAI
ncbi:hypothetical protein D3C81_1660140 [compost metagenome]